MTDAPQQARKIVGLGEVLWDIYNGRKFLGGSPANFAVHSALAGHNAYLCSRIGDDETGRAILTELQQKNINVSGVQLDIFKNTGVVRIRLDEFGHPSYDCTNAVAFDDMRLDSVWEELAPQMDVVFWGMLAQRSDISREAMQAFIKIANKAIKVCDLNIRRWDAAIEQTIMTNLQFADIIKLNKNECDLLKKGYGSQADDILFVRELIVKNNIQLAALTLGSQGCFLVTAEREEFDPGYFITPVDTSGAGDAFAAGLVHKYLQGASLADMADFANVLAAYVSMFQGATPPWTFDQLDNFKAKSL
ncbi:carbohydrate kinase [candidate division KSB1 bacterium]|nr:carbohydrate kinase [candidate division KSB1 bacterium]RQW07122.1 MAG: carbohydrate kinase [candidate division KSB1 bacterium]